MKWDREESRMGEKKKQGIEALFLVKYLFWFFLLLPSYPFIPPPFGLFLSACVGRIFLSKNLNC